MVVDAPPGERDVRMEFVMPLENRAGLGLTLLSLLAVALIMTRREH
jgi:hypothetical protein